MRRPALTASSGQATLMTVLFLFVLLAMAGAVLDVGSWFRADRRLQGTADAAALAGAHALPEDPARAGALALEYSGKNGGGVEAADVSFTSKVVANDTIRIEAEEQAPGIFSRLLGIQSVEVHATAAARAANLSSARYVAPVVVNEQHEKLQCKPLPCFGEATEIQLMDLHKPGSGDAAGSFGLLNLASRKMTGSPGSKEVGEWMSRGYDDYMPLGMYRAVPSTEFNSSHFQNALQLRVGDEVLFPIYRPPVLKGGQNAEFNIIGWVGFVVTSSKVQGDKGKIYGHFVRVIWEGIQSDDASQPDFGVRAISLVE